MPWVKSNLVDLPYNDYLEYFAPDYKLPITPNPVMENMNNKQYLDDILARILQNLKHAQGAIPIPPSAVCLCLTISLC